MKKLLLIMAGLVLSINLMGCETIKGFGKDVQNTGDNIQDIMTRSYDTHK